MVLWLSYRQVKARKEKKIKEIPISHALRYDLGGPTDLSAQQEDHLYERVGLRCLVCTHLYTPDVWNTRGRSCDICHKYNSHSSEGSASKDN